MNAAGGEVYGGEQRSKNLALPLRLTATEAFDLQAFVVDVGGPDVIGAVRLKIELWQTTEAALPRDGCIDCAGPGTRHVGDA